MMHTSSAARRGPMAGKEIMEQVQVFVRSNTKPLRRSIGNEPYNHEMGKKYAGACGQVAPL